MKKIFIFTAIFLCAFCVNLSAQDDSSNKVINLETTGTLAEKLTQQEKEQTISIKVSGVINEADIATLCMMATKYKLEKINLSDALFGKTISKLLEERNQYFLPMIAVLNTDNVSGMEEYEKSLGHRKDGNSVPGFWMYHTNKELFFMTGYMNGWDSKINEVVLKTQHGDLIRSPQIRSWIKTMGYEYRDCRTDGDIIFENPKTKIWCLLHFTPYSKTDYPGIHFSNEKYEVW